MKKTFLLIFTLAFLLVSCGNGFQSHSFFAMDTFISVDAQGTHADILRGMEELVYEDEKKFSRTFSGSGIYEFNDSCDGTQLSEDTRLLLKKAVRLYENTDGAFSPFLGTLTELWDIKNVNPRVPDDSDILKALENCDASGLTFENGIPQKSNKKLLVDLGGIAKGESAENCINYLRDHGVENAVISFGGSVACIGHSDKSDSHWSIGIKNPFDTAQITGSVNVTDCFIAVSGAYERSFTVDGRRYHHIFDPKTGYPAKSDIESVAVISDDGALSDGLSTALFVMGCDKALEFYNKGIYDFEAVLILKDGTVVVTDGIANDFTFNSSAYYKDGKKLKYNN